MNWQTDAVGDKITNFYIESFFGKECESWSTLSSTATQTDRRITHEIVVNFQRKFKKKPQNIVLFIPLSEIHKLLNLFFVLNNEFEGTINLIVFYFQYQQDGELYNLNLKISKLK